MLRMTSVDRTAGYSLLETGTLVDFQFRQIDYDRQREGADSLAGATCSQSNK